MSKQLSHINPQGDASMVNVGKKEARLRRARAQALVHLPPPVLTQLQTDAPTTAKGAVFQTAILAGIMAAKKTGDLIPLCHSIGMDHCDISIAFNSDQEIVVECTAQVTAKTGVEMEALTGASIAALTIYDMCKALSHDIIIKQIQLMEKSGGKTNFKRDA